METTMETTVTSDGDEDQETTMETSVMSDGSEDQETIKKNRLWHLKHPRKVFIAGIAEVLDKAGVASLLWDSNLIQLHGVPIVGGEVSFIVPDDLITASYEAVRGMEHLVECHQSPDCRHLRDTRGARPPAAHLHFAESYDPSKDDVGRVRLYKMSQIFHPQRMPDMNVHGKDVMLASDPRIPRMEMGWGCGPYSTDLHPVRILTPRYYVETLIRLCVRDCPETQERQEELGYNSISDWIRMLAYMGLYADSTWTEIFSWTELESHFRWYWKQCYRGRHKPKMRSYDALRLLKGKLLPWESQHTTT